jgi:hypothetical protein
MKNSNIKAILFASLIGVLFASCNNSPKAKEEVLNNLKDEVVDARKDLKESTIDSISEFNKYRNSIERKLTENERLIADLKAKDNSKTKAEEELYFKKLDKLELKNSELKSKIENYKEGPEQKWELFKVDFNKDLDDLGKSISNMAERNMKK